MLSTLRNALKVKDIRRKLWFTFLMLIVFDLDSASCAGRRQKLFANWFCSRPAMRLTSSMLLREDHSREYMLYSL